MPVYVRYNGWYVYFWTNENDEPIHFHIAEGKLPRMLQRYGF